MFKKLDEEKITTLLEAGISEFANKGFDKSNMNLIAKRAGLSVGVIYKYYTDKDEFFLACVRYSLNLLRDVLGKVMEDGFDVVANMRLVVWALIEHSKKHADYYVMYHEITAGGCKRFATMLAQEIESISAQVYTNLLENAKKSGVVRPDMDSRVFAFFFDNLLMMLQFSYCCDYYKERMRIYCGEGTLINDEHMVEELMKFMYAALGVETKNE